MTRTETAIRAFVAALDALTTPAGFPQPSRNEALITLLDNIGDGDGARINVLDGASEIDDEMLGADADPASEGYDLIQRIEVECVALAKEADKRDASFDTMLELVAQAVEADRTLGGAVSYAAIESVAREHIRIEGLPHIKGGIVTVALSFTSPRPF